MRVTRREVISGLLASSVVGSARAAAELPDMELRDIRVEGRLSKRFTMLLPRHMPDGSRVRLLVLLHGLGETVDEKTGAYAWVERYGLLSSYARLRRPPIYRAGDRADMTDERAAEITRQLAARPFHGMAFACPYLPAVQRGPELDEIARWLVEVVVPRARAESNMIIPDDAHTSIDGCSMGGFHALETFLRRPEKFATFGGVQTAITEMTAPGYADRMADALRKVGRKPLFLETSTEDAFRRGNETFAHELTRRGIACDFRMIPGPHDQPWIREAGAIEMLLWHDAH